MATRTREPDRPSGSLWPKGLLAWWFRRQFLPYLSDAKIHRRGKLLGPSLAEEILPLYQKAQRAYEFAQRQNKTSSGSRPPLHWHEIVLALQEKPRQKGKIHPLPNSPEIQEAWDATQKFCAMWNLDGYIARGGSSASVGWMRAVIYETLAVWANEENGTPDGQLHLPPNRNEELNIYEGWSSSGPGLTNHDLYPVASRPPFLMALDGPSARIGFEKFRFKINKKALEARTLVHWSPGEVPEYNLLEDYESWIERTLVLLEKRLRKHAREVRAKVKTREDVAFSLSSTDAIRRDWHFRAFALFQVGNLTKEDTETELGDVKAISGACTMEAAIRDIASKLEFPLRALCRARR